MKRLPIARLLLAAATLLTTTAATAQTVLSHDFSSVAQYEAYTVIDQNADGQSWQYDDIFLAASCPRDFDADDWLVSPALTLDATKTYRLTFSASVESEGGEQLSVMIGTAAQAASLTTPLMAATRVSSLSAQQYTAVFTVPASDTYHVAFHCTTSGDPFSNRLYLHDVTIEETINQQVPAAVADFTATAAADGSNAATLTFTTPDHSVGGAPLTQLTCVRLYRDSRLIATISEPAIGQAVSYADADVATGSHTYRAVAVNDFGEGPAAEATVYVGTDAPGPVENLRLVYDHATHQATLTWDPPTTGAHGGLLPTDGIIYEVRRFHAASPLATGLAATTVTDNVDIDFLLQAEEETRRQYENMGMAVSVTYVVDGQGLMQYYVKATSPQGSGPETVSNSVVMGEAYQLPFADSFADGALTHYWRTDIRTARARWSPLYDSRFPQDADGGMLGYNAIEGGETALCHTGNIDMSAATAPVLTFYYYYDAAWAQPLTVKTAVDGGDFTTLATIPLADDSQKGRWLRASLPLRGCAGHSRVQVAFEATTSTTVDVVYIDHVLIIDQRQNDLAVQAVAVPRSLKVGQTAYLTATIGNLGTADVATGQYSVNVYVNGQPAGSTMGTAIIAGGQQSAIVPLQATIDMQATDGKTQTAAVSVELDFAADEATYNNRSDEHSTLLKLPRHPEPTLLSATAAGTGVTLSWQQPAQPREADEYVTDSFEQYDDFQRTNFGEWSLYDGDQALTYGIGGWHFPKNSDIMSWMIWNPAEVENTTSGKKGLTDQLWYPRTGAKMLASFDAFEANCDDWLISPELSGNQQLISFYAHSQPKATAPDQFQLYISTSGAETTNFMALDQQPRTLTSSWDKYEYVLPQGTRHFAIRKVTYDGWVMFVDDVTFVPDSLGAQTGLMFFGYNVYRNGTRINSALVATTGFSDPDGKPGDVYRVTAVYNQGESVYSNSALADGENAIATPDGSGTQTHAATYNLQGQQVDATPRSRAIYIRGGKKVTIR